MPGKVCAGPQFSGKLGTFDASAEACELHRQYMEGYAKPGVRVICRERFMIGRVE